MIWQRLLVIDREYSKRFSLENSTGFLRSIAVILAHSGDSWFWFLGLGVAWYIGATPWKEAVVQFVQAILLCAVVVFVIKLLVRRKRPQGEWGSIPRNTDPHSFPSGHAARAFLIATMVSGYGIPWLMAITVLWAASVCLARVAMGVHYLSDILAGGLVGFFVAFGWLLVCCY